jgi:hypothetical protein
MISARTASLNLSRTPSYGGSSDHGSSLLFRDAGKMVHSGYHDITRGLTVLLRQISHRSDKVFRQAKNVARIIP